MTKCPRCGTTGPVCGCVDVPSVAKAGGSAFPLRFGQNGMLCVRCGVPALHEWSPRQFRCCSHECLTIASGGRYPLAA